MKKRLTVLLGIAGLYACHQEKPQTAVVKSPDYQHAESLADTHPDSAFFYFNKAAGSSKDSLQIAMAYNGMAEIQSDAGDYFGSQESLAVSLKFLDEQKIKDQSCLSADYNELGTNSLKLKSYDAAIAYYQRAIDLTDNPDYKATIANNQANAYQKKKAYGPALKLYRAAIAGMDTNGKIYARILTNMAITQWLRRPGYNAAPELLKALQIRRLKNDRWGQNASFARLADYYTRSRPDSALFYAGLLYNMATRLNNPDDRLEALQKLINLSPAKDAKRYFAAYQALSDSVQTARNAAKNQFALIRYGAEKNKADNLLLQKDNAEKKYQLIKQRILLYASVLALVAAIFWYRKRKQRLERETRHTIRESELRTSKKVHDVVANGLYRVMSDIENREDIDKEFLLDKIEGLYERSRDISYESPIADDRQFHQKIKELVLSFSDADRKVALVGNGESFWSKTSPQVKYELEQVLQELLVNMKKHSQARNVVVKFEQEGGQLHIHYTDDGTGLLENVPYKNGLTNTGNRIKAIRGTLIFDRNAGRGLKIHLAFPTA